MVQKSFVRRFENDTFESVFFKSVVVSTDHGNTPHYDSPSKWKKYTVGGAVKKYIGKIRYIFLPRQQL